MRAMVYRGPYKVRVEEKDIPPIEHPNDAIVRVSLAAICGSDLHTTCAGGLIFLGVRAVLKARRS